MTLTISLCIVTIWLTTVSTLVTRPPAQLQPPDSVPVSLHNVTTNGRINKPLLSLPLDDETLLDNGHGVASLVKLNLSVPPALKCDAGWGRILTMSSCGEAFANMPWWMSHESKPASFGPREMGLFNVGLPKRWVSSDGICGIQPYIVPGKESAHVAPYNAYVATAALIEKCVGGNPSMGGQIRGFGGDNNLLVTVGEYDPFLWSDNVRCLGGASVYANLESCNLMADQMETSKSPKTWGPRGQPHDYLVPDTREAADHQCYFRVTSHPSNRYPKTASWYDIWGAVIHLNAMCVRQGKMGTFKVHSDDMDGHWLQVEVGNIWMSNDNSTLPVTAV